MTNEDIVKLASIGRDTVFAVTAPQGTSLIVPDPDKTAPGQPPQYRWAGSWATSEGLLLLFRGALGYSQLILFRFQVCSLAYLKHSCVDRACSAATARIILSATVF